MLRNKLLFGGVAVGLVAALLVAHKASEKPRLPPPAFNPSPNPFTSGVFANGIVESYQEHGTNTNIYPEVTGTVTGILVADGATVAKGEPLLELDDSVQRATVEQLHAQAEAARVLRDQLRAQPRKETLAVARAQVELARANVKTAESELEKLQTSYAIDPRSVSKQTLDTAINNVGSMRASLDVATRQYELTQAGAWSYDIKNQEAQYLSLTKAHEAAAAVLRRYTLYAPRDGTVIMIGASVGSFVSPQGIYNPYTRMSDPVLVMADKGSLAVRCFIDEVLIPRLADPSRLVARMFVRGTNTSIPLEFVRVQPYVTPKIELSNARTEKVDLRVLQVIFRFTPPKGLALYPGQLVDVYLAAEGTEVPAVSTRDGSGGGRP